MAAITRSSSASPLVTLHSAINSTLFPLKSIADVVNFFQRSLEQSAALGTEPDLTLLSIVAGYIELSLTTGDAAQAAAAAAAATECVTSAAIGGSISSNGLAAAAAAAAAANADVIMGNSVPFPVLTLELVSCLYKKFQSILAVVDKPKASGQRQATREIIKKVSDVIWHSLIRSSYKDRAHLQNLYSYLSGNKLDCFGVALAVVAGCQLLGYRDVHLAISEDHAWVVFVNNKRVETIEVTWHGKGSEDKRGQDITHGIESGSWLYLRGLAVACDRNMEVAAIVSAINISLTANSDCVEVAELQQKLLWLLYGMGHLKKYPMALGTLGELEEINPTQSGKNAVTCEQLYREAIQSARDHYKNHHVYPYTCQGNYYNRLLKYREAFASWANAGDVIRLYTYNCRDDDEIYKELLDIANEMIPYVMKTESSGHSARSILRDSEVFANLLRFYDGICQWEEDSLTPILHIGWAKPLVNNITKFDYDIRSQVVIKVPEDESVAVVVEQTQTQTTSATESSAPIADKQQTINEAKNETKNGEKNSMEVNTNNNNNHNNINNVVPKKEEKSVTIDPSKKPKEIPTTLADLTAACGVKILNPDFLLQGGDQPFAEQLKYKANNNNNNNNNSNNNNNNNNINNEAELKDDDDEAKTVGEEKANEQQERKDSTRTNDVDEAAATKEKIEEVRTSETDEPETTGTITAITTTTTSTTVSTVSTSTLTSNTLIKSPVAPINTNITTTETQAPSIQTTELKVPEEEEDPFHFMLKRPVITLYSQKMKGLKNLLLAEKLNTHAISLQVTAQSVASRKVRGIDKLGHQTTSSTYATANVAAAAAVQSAVTVDAAAADSIALSRPKRMRRE